jgi:hypothetical protein
MLFPFDRPCGLGVTVPGYRYRGPGFDSRRCQIFWAAVGLARGPLSLVRTIEDLLGINSSGSYDRGVSLRWPRGTLYPQKWALTSPTSGGRSILRSACGLWSHGVVPFQYLNTRLLLWLRIGDVKITVNAFWNPILDECEWSASRSRRSNIYAPSIVVYDYDFTSLVLRNRFSGLFQLRINFWKYEACRGSVGFFEQGIGLYLRRTT